MDAQTKATFWNRPLPRWLMPALMLFFVALSIQYGIKASKGDSRSAILRWREQLLSLQDGEDIYERYVYPNPPIMALILLPIANLPDRLNVPPLVGAMTWFYLKVGMTLLALCWIFRMFEEHERPFPPWAKVLTVLLSLRSITGDLTHGNVNLFILFLVVAFLFALHRRRDWLAGILLALAISCKVTPALFVPYLVWKRHWSALMGCAVGMGLFFWPGLVPACYLGWDANLQQVNSWLDQMVRPYLVQGVVTAEHHNQSLPGFLYRLLTDSPSFVAYPNQQPVGVQWHNVASLPLSVAKALTKGFMLLFVLLVVWTCRTPRSSKSGPMLVAEWSMIVLGMLLFSERTWKHHCVTLMLPFAVLSHQLAVHWSQRGRRTVLLSAITVTVLLMSTTSISLLGRQAGKLAQVYGAYVFAFLVLLGAMAYLLRQEILDKKRQTKPETDQEWLRKAA